MQGASRWSADDDSDQREDRCFWFAKTEQIFSGLSAVEEAGGEEDDGDHDGEAGVEPVVEMDADESVDEPGSEAEKPDPGCLSHRRHRHR